MSQCRSRRSRHSDSSRQATRLLRQSSCGVPTSQCGRVFDDFANARRAASTSAAQALARVRPLDFAFVTRLSSIALLVVVLCGAPGAQLCLQRPMLEDPQENGVAGERCERPSASHLFLRPSVAQANRAVEHRLARLGIWVEAEVAITFELHRHLQLGICECRLDTRAVQQLQ